MGNASAGKSKLRAVGGEASPRWDEDALGFLIAPVTREAFLERYYERDALIANRGEPDRYADLLTLDMLDHFIASANLREGMVDLASQRSRIARDTYIDDRGRISSVGIAENYLRGATVILPHLHESMFNLGEFCRSLEEVFSCHVQTNIYLTPDQLGRNQQPGLSAPLRQSRRVRDADLRDQGLAALRRAGRDAYRGEEFQLGRHEPGEVTKEFTLDPATASTSRAG